VEIRHIGVPLLAEVKRAGRRLLTKVPFLKFMVIYMKLAQYDPFPTSCVSVHHPSASTVRRACCIMQWHLLVLQDCEPTNCGGSSSPNAGGQVRTGS
jgi:hypothetical protein